MTHDPVVILITVGNTAEGEHIARELVAAGHAACVNIVGPVRSVYRWQGAVQEDEEWQLVVKTTADRCGETEKLVTRLHSYDTPEFLVLNAAGASAAYGEWIVAATR